MESTVKKGPRPIHEIEATVKITPAGDESAPDTANSSFSGSVQEATTDAKTGTRKFQILADGTWEITITPKNDELSSGPARAEPDTDHGREIYEKNSKAKDENKKPKKSFPANKQYELEFRPLKIHVDVSVGRIENASFPDPPAASRPHHAVLFWRNVGESTTHQVLEVDWKPDFIRRIVGGLKPHHELRNSKEKKTLQEQIDVIMVHHTGGSSVGGALGGSFLQASAKNKRGTHFLIDLDGHVIRLADDRYNIRHGGGGSEIRVPSWKNESNINDRAIGIEHVHTDSKKLSKDTIQEPDPYTDAQYAASIELIRDLRTVYDVKLPDVIGHQDAVIKAACPGWHFDWPRLEDNGVALVPAQVSAAERDVMFGGFFAGEEGRRRRLPLESKEVEVRSKTDNSTTVTIKDKNGQTLARELRGRPIQELREALRQVGYSTEKSIVVDKKKRIFNDEKLEFFDFIMGFSLVQFIRHYCTERRLRPDLHLAYRDSPRVPHNLFVDFELAILIRGAANAAIAHRGELEPL